METLTLDTFKEKVFDFEKQKDWDFQGKKPAVIDFYADWCGPCRRLSPILDEISAEYADHLDVFKIDTEVSPELAALFGVKGLPSLLFIPLEGEPAMNAGFIPKENLEQAIEQILGIKK